MTPLAVDLPDALTVLVMAKAPVAGEAKTRLAADVGPHAAASVAAAALLDTVATCREAIGPRRCRLALAGDLGRAVDGDRIAAAVRDWDVVGQRGTTFGARLANAHADIAGPVLQIGMDTPQVTAEHLHAAASGLTDHDAVLGPASDGGWWSLAVRRGPTASPVTEVPMSTPTTCADTRAALTAEGLRVTTTRVLRDVDDLEDLREVARAAPAGRFGQVAASVLARHDDARQEGRP